MSHSCPSGHAYEIQSNVVLRQALCLVLYSVIPLLLCGYADFGHDN